MPYAVAGKSLMHCTIMPMPNAEITVVVAGYAEITVVVAGCSRT